MRGRKRGRELKLKRKERKEVDFSKRRTTLKEISLPNNRRNPPERSSSQSPNPNSSPN